MLSGPSGADRYRKLKIDESGAAGPPLPHNDHIHMPPNFSAFDTVEQIVDLAKDQDQAMVTASNYYDHRIYDQFAELCFDTGILPGFGLEIIVYDAELGAAGVKTNDPGNPGRIYLCGVATAHIVDPPAGPKATLSKIRDNDERRMAAMVEGINAVMAERDVPVRLSVEGITDKLVARHGVERESVVLQERHLAQALQEALFEAGSDGLPAMLEKAAGKPLSSPGDPVACQNELRSALLKSGKPAYVKEEFVDFDTAKDTILGLGGIPCYPILLDGASPINDFEADPKALVERLRQRGIHMAQYIPRRNDLQEVEAHAPYLREAGIALTVGTEHNTLELIPLQPACKGGTPLSPMLAEMFWEGACIAAAHQTLVSRGEAGFVGPAGERTGSPSRLAAIGDGLIRQVHGG
jgi:hypothetical protein